MRTFNQVAEDYIALCNERSESHRTALIQSSWTTDAVYVDPIAKAAGLADISALIGVRRQGDGICSVVGFLDQAPEAK